MSRVKTFLIIILFNLALFSNSLVLAQNAEPNAADLVRAVRESENWIHEVESFQLRTESVWITPKEPNEAEMKATGGRPYPSGSKHYLEIAFNNERVCYESGGENTSYTHRVWDGQKTISHERSSDKSKEHYYMENETERNFLFVPNMSWLRSQPHSFWFEVKDVNEQMKFFGYPDEFLLTGQENYRGIDCYVLTWKPKEGLYYAKDISFKWYVGINDKLLHGKITLYGDKVDTEHYMLDYQEIAPDCWFPMKQGYDIYTNWETRREIQVVKVLINEKLPEEMFQIEFKEGVEVVDNQSGQRIKYIYKAPLVGKAIPSLEGINFNFDFAKLDGNSLLFCFFDYEQRPSRNCISVLSKKAKELKAKDIAVIAIHLSKAGQAQLDDWMKKNSIDFPVGMIENDPSASLGTGLEQTKFNWGVRALPWLILTDKEHIVKAEGFSINELEEKIKTLNKQEKT